MDEQVCYKCKKTLPLDDFHKASREKSGHQSHCKVCAAICAKTRREKLLLDPVWAVKERTKSRENARKMGRNRRSHEQRKRDVIRRKRLFPEKYAANSACQHFPRIKGTSLHHWSYKEEHRKDAIRLTTAQHYLAHRFMTYDQERMMYRRLDGTLIDSREAAITYYNTLKDDFGVPFQALTTNPC